MCPALLSAEQEDVRGKRASHAPVQGCKAALVSVDVTQGFPGVGVVIEGLPCGWVNGLGPHLEQVCQSTQRGAYWMQDTAAVRSRQGCCPDVRGKVSTVVGNSSPAPTCWVGDGCADAPRDATCNDLLPQRKGVAVISGACTGGHRRSKASPVPCAAAGAELRFVHTVPTITGSEPGRQSGC